MGSLTEARRRILLSSPHKETIQNADIASFSTDIRSPLRALRVGIDPVQDLHGYDAPWPAGGGKNKLVPSVNGGSITWNDVTISAQNGELYLSGKATTSGGRTTLRTVNFSLPAGSYVISCPTTQFVLHDTSSNILANTLGTPTFTLTEETTVYAGFNVVADTTYSGVLKAQIESGTTATAYAPYSNLCPISGWTEANLWRTGKNLIDLSFLEFDDSVYAHDYYPATTPQVTEYAQLMAKFVGKTIVLSASITGTQSAGTQPIGTIRLVNSGGDMFQLRLNTPATVPDMDYSSIYYLIIYGSANGASVSDIQLELSSTPTAYSPYTGTTYPIPIPALGKNLLPNTPGRDSSGGLTYSVDPTTKKLVINGTASSTAYTREGITKANARYKLKAGTYMLSVDQFPTNTIGSYLNFEMFTSDGVKTQKVIYGNAVAKYVKFTIASDVVCDWWMAIAAGTYDNLQCGIQLELGSTATAYEPYTNTVYGGYISVSEDGSAELVVDRAKYTIDSTTPIAQIADNRTGLLRIKYTDGAPAYKTRASGISSVFPVITVEKAYNYAPEKCVFSLTGVYVMPPASIEHTEQAYLQWLTSVGTIEVVMELTTPITIPLSDIAITTLVGQNVVWGDSGKIEFLKYWTHK